MRCLGKLIVLVVSVGLAVAVLESSLGSDAPAGGAEKVTAKVAEVKAVRTRPTRLHRRPSGRRTALTEEQKAELAEFAKEYMPDLHERLTKLLQEDPRKAYRLQQQLFWVYRGVRRYPEGEVRKAAVGRYKVNVEIYRTLRSYRQSTDPTEKRRLKEQLVVLLGRRFDYDQTVKEYDVKRLEKQLADLTAEIAQRRRDRDRIIADGLKRLVDRPTAARPVKPPASK